MRFRLIELIHRFGFYYSPYQQCPEMITLRIPLFTLQILSEYFATSALFLTIKEALTVTEIGTYPSDCNSTIRALHKVYFHLIKQSIIDSSIVAKVNNNQATWGSICSGIFQDCFFNLVEVEVGKKITARIPSFQFNNCSYMTQELQRDPWSHPIEWSHNSLKIIAKNFLQSNIFAVPHRSTQIPELLFALENDPEQFNRIENDEDNTEIITKFIVFRKMKTSSRLSFEQLQTELKLLKKLRPEKMKARTEPTIKNRDFHFSFVATCLDFSPEMLAFVDRSCSSNTGVLLLKSGRYKISGNGRIVRRLKEERVEQLLHVPKSMELLLLGSVGTSHLFNPQRATVIRSILSPTNTIDMKALSNPIITQTIFDSK
jgi:hypothetical protein